MSGFPLKIVTPDGLKFDGIAQSLTVRTTTGDMGFLAGHRDCIAPLGMGRATIIVDGEKRYAACIGGMVSMVDGKATLVPTTFEWAVDIDLKRAERSQERAEALLREKSASKADIKLAEARLRRALVRQSVAQIK
jgi:F-type H+-transporting ATPase subunit epsilon